MYVIEFYLKQNVPEEVFEKLCETFYSIGKHKRRVDGVEWTSVFAVSYNPNTRWVQLLVDEDTPEEILTTIRSRARALSDNGKIAETHLPEEGVAGKVTLAPMERPRAEVEREMV